MNSDKNVQSNATNKIRWPDFLPAIIWIRFFSFIDCWMAAIHTYDKLKLFRLFSWLTIGQWPMIGQSIYIRHWVGADCRKNNSPLKRMQFVFLVLSERIALDVWAVDHRWQVQLVVKRYPIPELHVADHPVAFTHQADQFSVSFREMF